MSKVVITVDNKIPPQLIEHANRIVFDQLSKLGKIAGTDFKFEDIKEEIRQKHRLIFVINNIYSKRCAIYFDPVAVKTDGDCKHFCAFQDWDAWNALLTPTIMKLPNGETVTITGEVIYFNPPVKHLSKSLLNTLLANIK